MPLVSKYIANRVSSEFFRSQRDSSHRLKTHFPITGSDTSSSAWLNFVPHITNFVPQARAGQKRDTWTLYNCANMIVKPDANRCQR